MKSTDEKLRELVASWTWRSRVFESGYENEQGKSNAYLMCADELLSILDSQTVREGVTDGRQVLPHGWRIEVSECRGEYGLCVLAPRELGGFAVDRNTNHKSNVRAEIIEELHKAFVADAALGDKQ